MSKKEKINDFDRLVLFTLSYSSIFNFALKADEIEKRLPVVADFDFLLGKKKKTSFNKITKNSEKLNKSLKKLILIDLVDKKGDYYFLEKKDYSLRKKKKKFISEKEQELEKFINLAKKIPFIKAIFLTGSTAAENAAEGDDLDFLIICQANSIWISRFILLILAKVTGRRPHLDNDSKIKIDSKNAWCLNFWLDENKLLLPRERRSIYEAYEFLQMKLLYEKDDLRIKFIAANGWLNQYLEFKTNFKKKSYQANNKFFLKILNIFLYFLQSKYRVIFHNDAGFLISPDRAYLNNSEYKKKIFKKIKKIDI